MEHGIDSSGGNLSQDELNEHRKGYFAPYQFQCEIPDFFPALMKQIQQADADIVAIAFQEDCSPHPIITPISSPRKCQNIDYKLVKRTKMIGLGATTYKALFSFDLKMRGLRISIYARTALADSILAEESTLVTDIGMTQKEYVCSSMFLRNKGATASYIRVPGIGTIAFINAHLPFNSKGLMESVLKNDPMIRHNDVLSQNVCFNDIYRNLVLELEVPPDYVIYMGDFNYRLKPQMIGENHPLSIYTGIGRYLGAFEISGIFEERASPDIYRQFYLYSDELHEQMTKGNIYAFDEGIRNEGPIFLPTCKMLKGRPEGYDVPRVEKARISSRCFKIGIVNQRAPSWCDRILYRSLNERVAPLRCEEYYRFDEGSVMKKSDHAGVIGVFSVARPMS